MRDGNFIIAMSFLPIEILCRNGQNDNVIILYSNCFSSFPVTIVEGIL